MAKLTYESQGDAVEALADVTNILRQISFVDDDSPHLPVSALGFLVERLDEITDALRDAMRLP